MNIGDSIGLKGSCIGDYTGECCRVIKADTRSLGYGSYSLPCELRSI